MKPRRARCVPVWFFDLDDTLHDASHAIFAAIDTRMTDYVARHLGVGRADADALRRRYWLRYGATLLGMIRHHDVDPHDFLARTHDFDVAARLRAERGLAGWGRRLPGRKILLTNSPADYAGRVLRGIGLQREFPVRYAIERQRVHGQLRPKPSRAMLRALLARERLGPRGRGRAILVDDNLENLKAARAEGYVTVLMTGHRRPRRPRRLAGASYVRLRVRSVKQLFALSARVARRAA